jgi:hypothetical protein
MMLRPTLLLLAGILALGTLTLESTAASAQADGRSPVIPIKPTVTPKPGSSATSQKAPGKVCGNHKPNSQGHKDCIAQQAKIDKAQRDQKKAMQKKG